MFSSSPARFKSPFYKSQWSKGGVIERNVRSCGNFSISAVSFFFFAPLQTHPLGIRENDRSESSRLASNRKGRDNCGQRRCSTVRLLPPDSQLSACRMTNDVISTHLRHETRFRPLVFLPPGGIQVFGGERERERARADYSFTRVNYFQSLDFS